MSPEARWPLATRFWSIDPIYHRMPMLMDLFEAFVDHKVSVFEYESLADQVSTWLLFEGVEIVHDRGYTATDVRTGQSLEMANSRASLLTKLHTIRPDLFE